MRRNCLALAFIALIPILYFIYPTQNNVSPNPSTPSKLTVARIHLEDFESSSINTLVEWSPDTIPDDGPFSDNGIYFRLKGISPPKAFRASIPFGNEKWLTAELYTRSEETAIQDLFSFVKDPLDSTNTVIKLASPKHTDAVVIRSTHPLPKAYKITARVGFANFGDGNPGLNGYDKGTETSEPWSNYEAKKLNGFYWMSILDTMPRPHNNVWIHHHRKLTIDSCNHYPTWMQIYNGHGWKDSGVRPVMMFVLDGLSNNNERIGKSFISYANDTWQPSGEIKAVDSYKPRTWYQVSITRKPPKYILEVSGDFMFGGKKTYQATFNYKKIPVWHYNQPGEVAEDKTIDNTFFESLGPEYPHWPKNKSWPDYFMLGEPHNNFYEGDVLYDDIRLEVL